MRRCDKCATDGALGMWGGDDKNMDEFIQIEGLTGFYHVSSANISQNHQQMEWIEIGSFGEEHSEVGRQI